MIVLSNQVFPDSENIRFVTFGKTDAFQLRYDYRTPFPEFAARARVSHGIEAVFIFYPEYNAIPPAIEETGLPLYAFVSDWNFGYFPLAFNLMRFDGIFSDKTGTEQFRRFGYADARHWNMYGYLPAKIRKTHGPKSIDVLFIGNVNPCVQKSRTPFIKRLLDLSDQLTVRVETNLFGEAYYNAIDSAKVVFNRSIRGEANMRVFEVLGSGGLVFLEKGNIEIADYLEPGSECILYDDAELEKTLLRCVRDDTLRESVTRASSARAWDYSYPAFLERLYSMLSSNSRRPLYPESRKFHQLPEAERRYQSVLQLFIASGVQSVPEAVTAEIRSLMEQSPAGHHQGLFFLQLLGRLDAGRLTREELDLARRLFTFIKDRAEGCVFNYFNFTLLQEGMHDTAGAFETLRALYDILCRPLQPEAWWGVPGLRIYEEYYQEINLSLWKNDGAGLREVKEILCAIVLTRLGDLCLKLGDTDTAQECLTDALRHHGHNATALLTLGRIFLAREQYADAQRALESGYALNPFEPGFWEAMITAYMRQGLHRTALERIREFRRAEPLSLTVYGRTCGNLDKFEFQCREVIAIPI